ncbi:MAG TPA: DNA replication/repair protein RecF [Thermoanaerobacterales bacterium]|jgi:DNA replication and repair protein RecF|nr:DNA replication/repair protein RecF [Thermoanaerobacterales bacterium]
MDLSYLRLYDFRNFMELDVSFSKGINIFYGDNAQGKTNLLEAIFFICSLKTHRASRENELIYYEKPLAYVKGVFNTRTGIVEREVTAHQKHKKTVKEGGKNKTKWSELSPDIGAIFFSPDDLEIIKGQPSVRRKFIDDILYHIRPGYYRYLQGYYRVLSHRNALLKNIKKNISLPKMLDPWDIQLAEFGSQLVKERLKLLDVFSFLTTEFFIKFNKNKAILEIKYISSVNIDDVNSLKQEFLKLLKAQRNTDIKRTYTTIGPHRDDIQFLINGRDARTFGSQGQQRLLSLCLKFAHRELFFKEKGEYPILLLDDVMSELDSSRRKLILESEQNQVFITTTDLSLVPDDILEKSTTFYINSGQLR